MRKDVWAIFLHKSSTDDNPQHHFCPKNEDSWCKYNRAVLTGETYSHKNSLPMSVMSIIKPIFAVLSHPDLLKKCLHGSTQNANESLNHLIWNRLPKNIFVGLDTLVLGVHDAVLTFNEGNISKCHVLQKLGIKPGSNMVTVMKKIDLQRILQAEKAVDEFMKKVRQSTRNVKRRLEDQMEVTGDPEYGAGLF